MADGPFGAYTRGTPCIHQSCRQFQESFVAKVRLFADKLENSQALALTPLFPCQYHMHIQVGGGQRQDTKRYVL